MKSKLIGFMGAPSTGKTMLAGAMKEYAFLHGGKSTDVCTEYAREFVFTYGHPKHAYTQYRITSKQIQREDILSKGTAEYIFTDSPVWLGYIYALLKLKSTADIEVHTAISDMYELFVINQMHRYKKVFYVRTSETEDDGCRDMEENAQITAMMDGFVNLHQHILPITVVPEEFNHPLKRKEFIWDNLNGENNGGH